jgi:TonB family protein
VGKRGSPPSCGDCPSPDSPAEALKAKTKSATVFLEIVVSEKGEVMDVRVIKAPDKTLGEKAVDTVRKWKLKPAIGPNGKPVKAKVQVEVTFHLSPVS